MLRNYQDDFMTVIYVFIDMAELFVLLLIMHFVADFVFQNERMCIGKFEDGLCGASIYKHAFCVFCIPAVTITVISLVDFAFKGVMFSAVIFKSIVIGLIVGTMIAVPHLLIDALKSRIEKCSYRNTVIHDSPYEIFTFVGDQLLHFFILFLTAVVITKWVWQVPQFIERIDIKNLVFILMFIICGPPANILTRRILLYRHILKRDPNDKESGPTDGSRENAVNDEEPKTGQLMGSIERRLIIFFMFIDRFMAIGFLITAKSILRFNDIMQDDNKKDRKESGILKGYLTERSEYVLIGTFISVSIAFFCGYVAMIIGDSDVVKSFYGWLIDMMFKHG